MTLGLSPREVGESNRVTLLGVDFDKTKYLKKIVSKMN